MSEYLNKNQVGEQEATGVTISAEDARQALESINYHAAVMKKSAVQWRRKRPSGEASALACDRRFSELESLYRRIDESLKDAGDLT